MLHSRLNRYLTAAMAVVFLALSACAVKPYTEYDRGADFGQYHSFAWRMPDFGTVDHPILDNPLLGKRVHEDVVSVLEGRGYRQDENAPDFYVTFHTAFRTREQDTYLGFRAGHYWPYSRAVFVQMEPHREYDEGTLIIDIVDAKTNELVWRGWRNVFLSQQNFDEPRLYETVAYILDAFPPQ